MPIIDCGYAMERGIFSLVEVELMRNSIGDTIDRIARSFLTPFETSCPGQPLEARLECVAQKDRAYAYALLHGVFADAQHDPRLSSLAHHPVLMDRIRAFLAPKAVTGQIIRMRVNIPSFPQKRSPCKPGQHVLYTSGLLTGLGF